MTHGLLSICPDTVVFLEGGYNLEAIARSTQAVVETLMIGDDRNKFNEYLNEKMESELTYEELASKSLEKPLDEFKKVYENLLPLLKPHWKCL